MSSCSTSSARCSSPSRLVRRRDRPWSSSLADRRPDASGDELVSASAFLAARAAAARRRPGLPGHPHHLRSRSRTRAATSSSASTTTAGSSPTPISSIVLRNTADLGDPGRRCVATGDRPDLRGPGRPGPVRGVRQGADLPADGDLVRRRLASSGSSSTTTGPTEHDADRPAQPDPQSARASTPTSSCSPSRWNTFFLIVDHDLDPGRLRDDGALRRDQGDPRRHRRGGPARRRQRRCRCSATSPCRASGRR